MAIGTLLVLRRRAREGLESGTSYVWQGGPEPCKGVHQIPSIFLLPYFAPCTHLHPETTRSAIHGTQLQLISPGIYFSLIISSVSRTPSSCCQPHIVYCLPYRPWPLNVGKRYRRFTCWEIELIMISLPALILEDEKIYRYIDTLPLQVQDQFQATNKYQNYHLETNDRYLLHSGKDRADKNAVLTPLFNIALRRAI